MMKLLILTQKVDVKNDVLGFMHGWIAEFARQFEQVSVICLQAGEYSLPENVLVMPLGKPSILGRLKYIFNFYRYIWRERKNYDVVFVHMNPEYVVLGGLLWRLWGKTVGLWYAHGHVTWSLRIAEKFCNVILTSTVSGCRIKSGKVRVIGQGIDVGKFQPEAGRPWAGRIITVGRISPSKDYETLIQAAEILRARGVEFKIDIIGGLGLVNQDSYYRKLSELVSAKKLSSIVNFMGPVANEKIVPLLQKADLFVNMGQTGSLDKAVLEAMSAGLPVLTCNEAFKEVLGDYVEVLMYSKKDHARLADKIEWLAKMPDDERRSLGLNLRNIIIQNHSLKNFVAKIADIFHALGDFAT